MPAGLLASWIEWGISLCTSAVGSAIGSAISRAVGPAQCICHCTHGGSPEGRQALDLLSTQLDRCGPEQLRREPPPPAPIVVQDPQGGFVLAVFFGGLVVGIVIGWWLSSSCRRSSASQPWRLAVSDTPGAGFLAAPPSPSNKGKGARKGKVLTADDVGQI